MSLARTWLGDRLGRIKRSCVSGRINTASHGWGIKSSLGADDTLPAAELVGLPCPVVFVSEAPLTGKEKK